MQNDEINWNMRQFAAAAAKKGKEGLRLLLHARAAAATGSRRPTARPTPRKSPTSSTTRRAASAQPLEWNDVDRKLGDTMSSYWVNFVTKGDPNGSGLPAWPQYKDMSKDKVIVLGDTVQVEATVPAEKLAFFNARHVKLMKGN